MQKDPTPVDVDTSKPAPAYRPNLSQSMYVGNDDERILSSLKMPAYDAGQTAAAPKKSWFMLPALVLAGGAAAFVGYQYFAGQSKSSKPPVELAMAGNAAAGKKSNPVIEEKAEPPAPAAPAAIAPVAPVPAAAEAAQIVNEPPAAKTPVATSQAKLTEALEEGVKPPNAALQKALEVKSPATGAAAAAATPAPKVAAEPAAPKVASPAPAKAAAPAATAQKKSTSDAEKDINLIAALLTHNNAAPGAANAKPAAASTEAKKPNAAASADKPVAVVAAAPQAESTEA